MPLKLKQLRHLLALEDQGSFVLAAAALHISQPALSRSIRALELLVGAPLFVRDAHGVVPTDMGRVMISRAREIVGLVDELLGEMVDRQALAVQELVVGAGPFPAATVVHRAVAGMIAARPSLRLRVEVGNWDDLLVRLKSHELHLFVAETSTLAHADDLRVEPLSRQPLYFIARRGHPLAGSSANELGAIFRYPTISLARIPPRLLDPILMVLGRSPAGKADRRALPTLLCTDLHVARAVAADTDAIMVASLVSVAPELARGDLVVVGTAPWLRLEYGMVTVAGRETTDPQVAAFREQLLAAQALVESQEHALAQGLGLAD